MGGVARPSIHDRAGFERGLALFYVHAELHALGAVAVPELVVLLFQRLFELLVGEAVRVLAALLLQAHELVEHRVPLGELRGSTAPTGELGRGRAWAPGR